MEKQRTTSSEVIGFEEFRGSLHVRLRTGTVPILDENGQAVIVNDPAIRQKLFARPGKRIETNDRDTWDPWRQGP
jgi:hypothetical protein